MIPGIYSAEFIHPDVKQLIKAISALSAPLAQLGQMPADDNTPLPANEAVRALRHTRRYIGRIEVWLKQCNIIIEGHDYCDTHAMAGGGVFEIADANKLTVLAEILATQLDHLKIDFQTAENSAAWRSHLSSLKAYKYLSLRTLDSLREALLDVANIIKGRAG